MSYVVIVIIEEIGNTSSYSLIYAVSSSESIETFFICDYKIVLVDFGTFIEIIYLSSVRKVLMLKEI